MERLLVSEPEDLVLIPNPATNLPNTLGYLSLSPQRNKPFLCVVTTFSTQKPLSLVVAGFAFYNNYLPTSGVHAAIFHAIRMD